MFVNGHTRIAAEPRYQLRDGPSRGPKMRYAVAILLALTMPAGAQDTTTANQMLPGCKGLLDHSMTSGVSVYHQGRCGGYVAGLVYGVGGQEFCSPEGVTIDQAVAVVVKYIEARPERMHEHFGKLAQEAMMAAWPCKR